MSVNCITRCLTDFFGCLFNQHPEVQTSISPIASMSLPIISSTSSIADRPIKPSLHERGYHLKPHKQPEAPTALDWSTGKVIRRAAFDFGSGSIKMEIADVDIKTNTIIRTLKFDKGENIKKIPFIEPIKDPAYFCDTKVKFSETVIQKSVTAMTQLMKLAKENGATQFSGFSTFMFRLAGKSSKRLLRVVKKKCNISIETVSAKREGILGFQTAVHLLSQKIPKASKRDIIVWDIGTGSSQISECIANKIQVLTMESSSGILLAASMRQILERNEKAPLHPILNDKDYPEYQDIKNFLKILLSGGKSLSKKSIYVIGGFPKELRNLGVITQEQIEKIVLKRLCKTEAELKVDFPEESDPDLYTGITFLLQAFMEKKGIAEVRYLPAPSGNTPAWLVNSKKWASF